MRLIVFIFAFCFSLAGQGTVSVIPNLPVTGALTTLVLTASPLPAGSVVWDFGDGKSLTGGTVVTHLYARQGSFTVRAVFLPINGQQLTSVQAQVRVVSAQGPSAPFAISLLRMRWEDGKTDRSVTQGFAPLVAFADLKYAGTGLLQAQWVVDGIPMGTFTRQLAFAGMVSLDSGTLVPLPTTAPGEHLVSLRILSPVVSFQAPAIRYFVRLGNGEEAVWIEEITPSVLRPGQEAELRITGKGLKRETTIAFGKDIAQVSPLRFSDPERALVKVFVAPTAKPGLRDIQARSRSGRSHAPAHLQILPPPNSAGR
jgi:hypothetical protein